MNTPDLINGLFELFGGILMWKNVAQIRKHKAVRGVHWVPTAFWIAWGLWNLYFYPHLDQWMSFTGGLLIVVGNGVYLWFIRKYWNGELVDKWSVLRSKLKEQLKAANFCPDSDCLYHSKRARFIIEDVLKDMDKMDQHYGGS